MKKYFCIVILIFTILESSVGKNGFKNQTNNKNSKEKIILEKALDLILNENKNYICQHKKLVGEECPLLVSVNEVEDFQEFKCFTVCFLGTGISDSILPSYLLKKKGVYCAIYKKGIL